MKYYSLFASYFAEQQCLNFDAAGNLTPTLCESNYYYTNSELENHLNSNGNIQNGTEIRNSHFLETQTCLFKVGC